MENISGEYVYILHVHVRVYPLIHPDSGGAPFTVFVLEEERRAAARDAAVRHDGDPVAQHVSLVHVVRRQDDRPTCATRRRITSSVRSRKT